MRSPILENDLEARAHFKSLHPGCIVLESDWDQLCDERYDAVVMIGMAEHMAIVNCVELCRP